MEPIGPIGINSLGHIAPIGLVKPIGPIGINSLVQIAPIGPVEPIGPIGINSTYRGNWADGTNWPNWHQFIGTYRTNWARGTNWPNWHTWYILRQLGPWNQLAQLASIGHIALIGPTEPIGPIGINSFRGTYRTNWANGTNRPNCHT